MNRTALPAETEGLVGVRAMETKAGGVTVSVDEPLTVPSAALTRIVPCPVLVANPWLLMFAMAEFEELQTTELVRSETVPFLKRPVAANCCFNPNAMEAVDGATEMDASPEADPVPERLVT